jgi:hypothetical protein
LQIWAIFANNFNYFTPKTRTIVYYKNLERDALIQLRRLTKTPQNQGLTTKLKNIFFGSFFCKILFVKIFRPLRLLAGHSSPPNYANRAPFFALIRRINKKAEKNQSAQLKKERKRKKEKKTYFPNVQTQKRHP